MSDPGKFLSRWSRRKREAAEVTDETKSPAASEPAVENARAAKAAPSDNPATPGDAPESAAPIFDPASLPAIESITADTDIRAFLAPGVPPELTRAALRRAWAADPKIRDFVGLADYDWDFNAADSMAGFGPLEMTDDVAKMAAHILEPNRTEPRPCTPLDPASAIPHAEEATEKTDIGTARSAAAEMPDHATDRDRPVNEIGKPAPADALTDRERERVAVQYTTTKPENRDVLVRRQHGGALPK